MKEPNVEIFAKAVGGLAGHFKKMADHHIELHKRHSALSAAHASHAAFVKAKADASADDDANKAYFGNAHEFHKAAVDHHSAIAGCHKAMAEHSSGMADAVGESEKAMKAAGVEISDQKAAAAAAAGGNAPATNSDGTATVAGDAVAAMMDKTIKTLTDKALATLETDPKVTELIQKIVIDRVTALIGDKVKPDGAFRVTPTDDLRLVTRVGQPTPVDLSKVDPELLALVEGT